MKNQSLKALAIVLGVALYQAAHAVAVNNGSFETHDYTGWTYGGQAGISLITAGAFGPVTGAEDGTYYAAFSIFGADGTLSQTIADTAGASYTLSWWLASDGRIPNDFNVSFGGSSVFSAVNIAQQGWTEYSETVTGTGSDVLELGFRNDFSLQLFDNISLTSLTSLTSNVPDRGPGFVLAAATLLGLCGAGYAFRRQTACA